MKYHSLLKIKDFLKQYKKIFFIKRIDDNLFKIAFEKDFFLLFDLSKNSSGIYTAKLLEKEYKAPFDLMLKKHFSSVNIKDIYVPKNNRILIFKISASKAYKSFELKIYFEFTGRNTNVIMVDENDIVLCALRYVDKSYRVVKTGLKLEPLKEIEIKEKSEEITNFDEYFKSSFENLTKQELLNTKKIKLTKLDKKIKALNTIMQGLEQENELLKRADEHSKRADLLFCNLHEIQNFQRKFSLKDFDGNEVHFELSKNAKESANDFYKLAKKLKQKAKNIHLQRQNLQDKLENLQELQKLIKLAKSKVELEILLPNKEKIDKQNEDRPSVLNFYFNNFKISAGKNERANEYLLKEAKKDDLWFHIKDFPSSHVFIRSNKEKINYDVIEFAANLCVNLSNLQAGSYLVDYTQRKFVKIQQKAFVQYTNYKSLKIAKE